MEPRLVTFDGAVVIGIDLVTSNTAEADPAHGKIPALWGRFRSENVLDAVPGKSTPVAPVGVYTDYEGDETGEFHLIAGAMVEPNTAVPAGLRRVELRAGRYLVFGAEGELPRIVIETWKAIWRYFSESTESRRAFATDFEIYPGPTRVDIYIGVEPSDR